MTGEDLNNARKQFVRDKADSMLSVVLQKRFFWETQGGYVKPVNYTPETRPRRQDFGGTLVENGAFYLSSRDNILKNKCRISGKISAYEMDEATYLRLTNPLTGQSLNSSLKKGH